MNSRLRRALPLLAAIMTLGLSLGLTACEKKGPLEKAGEEVDEAVDTIKNGGEESTKNKVDDAIDEAREGAQDAADELKKKD
jgi:hyperosmotically inducible protein